MKNVLYITYDGLTDPLGQSQVLPYLKYLSKTGVLFTVLSFEKRERFMKENSIIQSIVKSSGIQWVPLFFTSHPPILAKLYDRYQMQRSAVELYKRKQFDAVHCRSYVAAEIGLLLKGRYGVKMIFDMRGFWADEKVDNGQWNLRNPFYKKLYQFYKKKENAFLLGADAIISLTEKAKFQLLQQPAYSRLHIDVIPCCADLEHFDYTKTDAGSVTALKEQLFMPLGARVLTYLGSVGGWYMTKEMFRFFLQLLQHRPEYVLLILTKDNPVVVKKEAIAEGVPPEKVFILYATRKELPPYLALSTCSIFFIRNTFSKMASSPTKHAELMGMGIPVICNDIGDTGRIIKETKTGMLIDRFGTEDLQECIADVAQIEQLDKAYIREQAKELFDLHTGVERYRAIYNRILEGEGAHAK